VREKCFSPGKTGELTSGKKEDVIRACKVTGKESLPDAPDRLQKERERKDCSPWGRLKGNVAFLAITKIPAARGRGGVVK